MNSNSILNSSLLDIIFENRNKDYGAYVLRRDYNKRLLKSLLAVLAFVIICCFLQLIKEKNVSPGIDIVPLIPDLTTSYIEPTKKKVEPKKIIQPKVKPAKILNDNPLIVKEKPADKPIPLNVQMPASGIENNNEAPFESSIENSLNTAVEEIKPLVKAPVSVIDKNIPVTSVDVLPEYPGGINELMKFLKRNLNTPRELEDGEEIAVKVRFIVNYNGELKGFNVAESGGESFDNEVIRVLKKMPKWIPGKVKGENVSVHFVIPVKFTVSY